MKELFQIDSKEQYVHSGKEPDLAMGYAHKFWDAGNQVVLLIYGAAFGIYIALGNSTVLLDEAKANWIHLIILALLGNAALMFLIFRLYVHEHRVAKTITNNSILLDGIKSAFHMRLVLVVINLAIYLWVVLALLR